MSESIAGIKPHGAKEDHPVHNWFPVLDGEEWRSDCGRVSERPPVPATAPVPVDQLCPACLWFPYELDALGVDRQDPGRADLLAWFQAR